MNAIALLLPIVALFQPTAPKMSARLLADHESPRPGGQIELAIEVTVEKDWHVYHPIVLDTGAPTTIDLDVPAGVTLGELRFPVPRLGKEYGMEYLALDGKFVVLTTLSLSAEAETGPMEIRAKVHGLACKQLCLPVEARAALRLDVSDDEPRPANQKLFEEARASLPRVLARAPYIAGSKLDISSETIGLDDEAEIVLSVRVQRDHHVQDQDPGNENLIASRLFIERLNGVELGEQKWPKPHIRETNYFGKVREQSGQFKISVPLGVADEKFASGPVALRVLFTYQSCSNAGMCFPPEAAEAVVRFTAQTPNGPSEDGRAQGSLYAGHIKLDDVGTTELPGAAAGGDDQAQSEPVTEFFAIPELTDADWADHIPWQTWKPGLPEALARQGRLVYVDFTATWCLTCQANKRVVLETDVVREEMRKLGVIPVKADFTNRDAAMQKEISRWRPTVPVNVIYPPGKPDQIALLPVVLSQSTVIDALNNPEQYANGDPTASQNLLLVMLGGFLGGLILNIMPCVLPVISIKILSFVQQAGEDPKRVLRLGLAFCAGIMVWFWAFAALTSIGQLPWQYPEVVVTLGSLLFLFSLSLFGVFEIVLPGAAAGTLDSMASREGYGGAFVKGLLATLLGTACTAPFLAGAMAYALSQPAWIVFLVFSAAGLGMASPYLLLSARPAWLKFIPKPGAWMVTFKQATGFVLLGTVVWLLWILSDQIDAKGVVWTIGFFGFLGLAAWMVGKTRLTWNTSRRATLWIAAVAVVVAGFLFCYVLMYDWNNGKHASAADPARAVIAVLGGGSPDR